MEELIKHVAAGLKDNVLRHQLQMEEALNLEWSWKEEPNRGGFECTILTHVPAGANPINIQSKKKLHWRMLDVISAMNNEVEFICLGHNLLLRKVTKGKNRQLYMFMILSVQVSPQVARKKHFMSLNLECSRASNATTPSNTLIFQIPEMDRSEDSNQEPTSE